MAKFELTIYGNDDEVLKQYATDHIRWASFLEALKLQDEIKDSDTVKQFEAINKYIVSVFEGLTLDELNKADGFDVINTFYQILSAANKVKGSNSKNA